MDYSGLDRREILAEAAKHLRAALELLDSACAPAQIGAHVDLAAHQLEGELAVVGANDLSSDQRVENY
ncbi:MAG TPA: hypothetical protein VFS39_01480 [Nitrospira sp.]|nr:hypothetical protein [Nitrospira sp.]